MKTPRIKLPLLLVAMVLMLSACKQQETTHPVRKDIEEAVFASGYLEQEHHYTVSAKVEGILLALPVQEGDSVKKGQCIAIIENEVQDNQLQDAVVVYEDAVSNAAPGSPQLQSLQTQLQQAEQQLAFDQEHYQRYRALREKNSISQLDFERAELQFQAAQNNLIALQKQYKEVQKSLALSVERSRVQVLTQRSLLKDYKLNTLASGTVIKVLKKEGELVRRGEAIAQIGSGAYKVKLFVAEDDIAQIELGQQVALNINTYPDQRFSAEVSKIFPGFDEAEQSYVVEATFTQVPEKMFSGTQLQANIKTQHRQNVLVIPSDYVAKGDKVILATGEEKQIQKGSQDGVWTEVIVGLNENDHLTKPK